MYLNNGKGTVLTESIALTLTLDVFKLSYRIYVSVSFATLTLTLDVFKYKSISSSIH